MIPNEENENIKKGMLNLNIVWAAMFLSLSIYLVVGLYTKAAINIAMDKVIVDMLRNALYAVALITLIGTRFIRKLALAGKWIKVDQSTQSNQSPAMTRYTSAMLLSLALTESIGIYGFVLYLLGKNEADLYIFLLISAVTMVFYRPRKDEIVNLTEELNRHGANASTQ